MSAISAFTFLGSDLFVGMNGCGIFKSTNNGTNWYLANNGFTSLWVKAFAVSGTNLFVGSSDNGVFLSTK